MWSAEPSGLRPVGKQRWREEEEERRINARYSNPNPVLGSGHGREHVSGRAGAEPELRM
jgi:hypothetical protein